MRGWVTAAAVGALAAGLCAAAEGAPPIRTGMIEVKEPALYYEEAGGGPAVILIHGGQLDGRMWDGQFMAFAARYRVVRYDVRGFGRSEEARHPYSDVEDLAALMDALQIDRAALVGLSLGGRIAIDFALEHPGRVSAIALSGPGLSGHAWSQEAVADYQTQLKAAQEGPAQATEAWLRNPYMAPAMENPAIAPRIRQLAADNARVWLENPLLARDLDPPAAGRLVEIKAPVLALVGDRDVADIQSIVKRIGASVAGAKVVGVPGAGHIIPMEKPEEFNRLVLDFLGKALGPR